MGNFCQCSQEIQPINEVNEMVNVTTIPDFDNFPKIKPDASRFGQPIFTRRRENMYNFLMTVRTGQGLQQISLDMVILRELVDCILHDEYDLEIDNTTIIDIFEVKNTKDLPIYYSMDQLSNFEQILMSASHRKNKARYSLKIYGFKSYQDDLFRRGLYEIFLHNRLGLNNKGILNLLHYYIIDRSPSQKALIFLFEPVETSLSNIIEYRNLANENWTELQILGILKSVFTGYSDLQKLRIFHRDLRPSRIYYSQIKNQYLIGNLSNARIIPHHDNFDMLSVRGIHYFNSKPVQQIVQNHDVCGRYDPKQNDYHFLLKLIDYLFNLSYTSIVKKPSSQIFKIIYRELEQGALMEDILKHLVQVDFKVRDYNYVSNIIILVNSINSKLNDLVLLNAYYNLHYNQEFSKLAHTHIEHNIESERSQDNAHIFFRLAEYYSSTGNSSQDYYLNSFLLFLKKASRKRKMGYYNEALHQLSLAKRCYKFLEDADYQVQYSKQLALTKCKTNQLKEAGEIIDQTIQEAANKGIAPQLQLELMLAKADIYYELDRLQQSQKFLKQGLLLCENGQNFDKDDERQSKFKAQFLMALGRSYLKQANFSTMSHSSTVNGSGIAQRRRKYLSKAEKNLESSLDLKQHTSTQNISISQLHDLLGMLYYSRKDMYRAKKQYMEAIKRKQSYKDALNPMLKVQSLYDLGNCCKNLQQLIQAQNYYSQAIQILQLEENRQNQAHLCLVIKGNRALVKLQLGKYEEGMKQANEVLQQLKQLKGENHTDYVYLQKKVNNFLAKIQESKLMKTKRYV